MRQLASGDGSWGLTAVRITSGLVLVLLIFLAIAKWRRGGSIFEWQASLLATEFSHWLAVIAVVTGVTAALTWPFFQIRWGGLFLCVALGLIFLLPAWRASQSVSTFSWSRLWLPGQGREHTAVHVERRTYREAGALGPAMEVVVCRPDLDSPPKTGLPWVLSLHGGGWNSGRPDEFLAADRELASHGYVVLMPAYRLAPESRWPAPREDVRDAIAWAREHADQLGLDPARLTLLGRSAGGQIATACAFGCPELRVEKCIALYAPHDLFFAWEYAREDDVLNSMKLLRDYLGGTPQTVGEAYRTASGIRLVSQKAPATLLIHGRRDSLVWVEQSRRLAKQMDAIGAKARFVELPWATHACDYFPWTPGGQTVMAEVLAFLEKE